MAGFVENVGRSKGITEALWMTLGVSDGTRLYALRYASDGAARRSTTAATSTPSTGRIRTCAANSAFRLVLSFRSQPARSKISFSKSRRARACRSRRVKSRSLPSSRSSPTHEGRTVGSSFQRALTLAIASPILLPTFRVLRASAIKSAPSRIAHVATK